MTEPKVANLMQFGSFVIDTLRAVGIDIHQRMGLMVERAKELTLGFPNEVADTDTDPWLKPALESGYMHCSHRHCFAVLIGLPGDLCDGCLEQDPGKDEPSCDQCDNDQTEGP